MKRKGTDLQTGPSEIETSFLEKAANLTGVAFWGIEQIGSGAPCIELQPGCSVLLNADQERFDGTVESFVKFFHETEHDGLRKSFDHLFTRHQSISAELKLGNFHEQPRWVSLFIVEENGVYRGVLQDITTKRATEDSLLKMYERYEFLTKATKDAIWDWDYENDFITWNHGVETNFGYKEREVKGATEWRQQRIFAADYRRVEEELADTFLHQRPNWQSTYRIRCADGALKHVYDRAYIIYHTKKPVRLLGSLQDISASIQAMDEIRKLSLVASSTDNIVFMLDRRGLIEWTNESFVSTLGYTLGEVFGRDPKQILLGSDTDRNVLRRILDGLALAEPINEEILLYSKSGKSLWAKILINPVFDEEHNLLHFVAVGSDITNQKEFERNITAIVRELASLIENANVPIFGIDRNGYINEWNRVTESITGYKKNEILGRHFSGEFLEREFVSKFEELTETVLEGKPVSNFQLPIVTRSLTRRMLLLGASSRISTSMEATGVIVVAQDITELVEYRSGLERMVDERTHELNEALKKEKELLDLRSRFVSIASHEFRTPLSTISLAAGYLDRYFEKLSKEDVRTKTSGILRQVEHMKTLLDDVLTIGKAEAGKIQVHLAPLPVFAWLKQVVEEVQLSTGNTHLIDLTRSGEQDVVITDEKLMRNIAINLLTNAIKFSPESKKVDLNISVREGGLLLEVKDYGVGIPDEDQKNLFTPFYRAGNVSSIKGTGLGLSIVKKAVELMGGKLEMQSKEGEGTRFRVVLPPLMPADSALR